ncbi:hypothetical protein IMZ78_02670 [Bacillus anthracis]|uniref:hypothetical protein n=1 Tax=Bacillus anthracis TaxID=1392 RepID=UPI00186874C2|nr:hypothetical protein [Bacillus anthracis]MBE3641225.1 hypothetical protein [Bacillus anthracis]MDA2122459.1 hypothetical protein [Bacillus cereus]
MKRIEDNIWHAFGEPLKFGFGTYLTAKAKVDLNPIRSIFEVLGILAKYPQLLLNPRMTLCEDDFVQTFHQMVFSAIKDIVCKDNSIKTLTYVDIDNHLSKDKELYELWLYCNGIDYMRDAIELSNKHTFKIHYRELKKHTLMQHFACAGVDISSVHDYLQTDIPLLSRSEKRVRTLTYEELESELIPLGKGNDDMQQLLSDQQQLIDTHISILMKRKQELQSLQDKLK